jgi:hypothetical protein
MRRSSKRLGQVLESYEQAAFLREPRAGALLTAPRRVASTLEEIEASELDPAVSEAYLAGVTEQATAYLEELRSGERVLMRFEYHSLSPIDGGPRDIDVLDLLRELCRKAGFSFESEPVDDIGVHLTPVRGAPVSPLRVVPPRF